MEASCRDLGLMDYKTCWELQQGLFDALVARKAACKGATKQAAAPLAANAGTAEASKASAREPETQSRLRAEFEALAAPYYAGNVVRQDYLLTRARAA